MSNSVYQRWTKPGRQIVRSSQSCTSAHNIFESSVWSLTSCLTSGVWNFELTPRFSENLRGPDVNMPLVMQAHRPSFYFILLSSKYYRQHPPERRRSVLFYSDLKYIRRCKAKRLCFLKLDVWDRKQGNKESLNRVVAFIRRDWSL